MHRLTLSLFLSLLPLAACPMRAQDSQAAANAQSPTKSDAAKVSTIVFEQGEYKIQGRVFVSCEVKSIAGMARVSTVFTLTNGDAHVARNFFIPAKENEEKHVKLSQGEMIQFLHLIEEAQFPTLKPSYRQKGLFDAGMAITTLKLRSEGKEQVYTVSVYGHTAPEAYYKFQSAVWEFERKNLPQKR